MQRKLAAQALELDTAQARRARAEKEANDVVALARQTPLLTAELASTSQLLQQRQSDLRSTLDLLQVMLAEVPLLLFIFYFFL